MEYEIYNILHTLYSNKIEDLNLTINSDRPHFSSKLFYNGKGAENWIELSKKMKSNQEKLLLFLENSKFCFQSKPLNFIEVGPGDFSKTKNITRFLLENINESITFFALDSSSQLLFPPKESESFSNLNEIKKMILNRNGTMHALEIDLFKINEINYSLLKGTQKFVSFLGGTIGNIDYDHFLETMKSFLHIGDYLILDLPLTSSTSTTSSENRILKSQFQHLDFITDFGLTPDEFTYKIIVENYNQNNLGACSQEIKLMAQLLTSKEIHGIPLSEKYFELFYWRRYDLEKFKIECLKKGFEIWNEILTEDNGTSYLVLKKAT